MYNVPQSGVQIRSHLEEQFISYQKDKVPSMRSISHLEVISANRTPCSEATNSQVRKSVRT